MLRFNSVAEVQDERRRLDGEFESGLPDYLQDYFDSEELKLVETEFYVNKRRAKYEYSNEEKRAYKTRETEEFWKNNTAEIVKKPRTVGSHLEPVYQPPARATERVEEEIELSQEDKQILIRLCEDDLELFAVRYFPHYLKKPSSKLHKFLYKTLTEEINNTKREDGFKWAIAAPRHNAKSSIVSAILPLWCICYNKKRFICIISDTADQAQDFLSDIKSELTDNEKLAEDFPYAIGKGETWRLDNIVTPNNIKVMALGTGNKIRGRRFGVHRPDLIVGDDLENSEMVRSKTQRHFIRYTWFDKDLAYIGGEKGSRTDFIIVGTVLSKDSLLNQLLDSDEYPEFKSMRFAAVRRFSDNPLWDEWSKILKNRFDIDRKETAQKFFEERSTEMLKNTVVLWPEGDPYYDLMVQKVTKPSAFITEKQNEPVDTTKIYISKDELHWENFRSQPDIKKAFRNRVDYFGSIDPSLGKKSTKGDYSAIVTIAKDRRNGNIYVVEMNLKRRSVDEQIEAILQAHRKYKYKLFGVETNAFQYVLADSLRKKAKAEGMLLPIKEKNQYRDKKARFEGMLPFLTDGTIMFNTDKDKNSAKYALGIEQICTFTGDNDEHDDAPDALELAFSVCKAKRFKMITKSTK